MHELELARRVIEKLVHHLGQDALDQVSLQLEHLARSLDDSELVSHGICPACFGRYASGVAYPA